MSGRKPSGQGPLSFPPEEGPSGRADWEHRRDPDVEPAARRDEDIPPPARPRTSRYGWLLAITVLLILAYIGLNTLRNAGSVPRGVPAGHRLPPFAVPTALSPLEGDANLATASGQGQRGRRPACDVRGRGILNTCTLTARAPAVLTFAHTGVRACAAQLDDVERVRRRFGAVHFAAVAAPTNRAALRRLIRSRGWNFGIGYDRDGGIFARYGVVDCPMTVFSYPGGVAMRTTVKPLDEERLGAAVGALVRASERRGWKPPTS
jgi:hypothetical protein